VLISDNHYIDQPGGLDGDYHLSEDLAATAVSYLLDQQQAAPGKPFFLYFALGAAHAPHHVAPRWTEPYLGQFDRGWDAWRREIFARQLASGVVPEGTILTPLPSANGRCHPRTAAGRATTDHVSAGIIDEEERMAGSRRFEDDHWALFDLDRDFSEATDIWCGASGHSGARLCHHCLYDRPARGAACWPR
jgi:arylsulfatase A-like enzyme